VFPWFVPATTALKCFVLAADFVSRVAVVLSSVGIPLYLQNKESADLAY